MPMLAQVEELRAGMTLFEALIANGRVMLQGGKALTWWDINALRRRYPGLTVRIGDPVLDGVVPFEDDSRERDVAYEVQQKVSNSMYQVRQRFMERTSLRTADISVLHAAVQELMVFLKCNPTSAAVLTGCLDHDSYLATHTGNVFYLSMLLGSAVLEYVAAERKRQTQARDMDTRLAQDLSSLGLGVMAMDLGMLPLGRIYTRKQALTDSERQAIREHPSVGVGMLPENTSALARMIVRTHHENYDGSGYPERLPGEKVHVFTRIVRIADAYDAATSKRVYKGARSPVRALWEMKFGPYRRFYDPILITAFTRLIQPFPIGSRLLLEDGRQAVVIRYNRKDSFRPTVVIAFDERNRQVSHGELQTPINLVDHPELRIKSCQGEDLLFLADTEGTGEVQAQEAFTTLLDAAYP